MMKFTSYVRIIKKLGYNFSTTIKHYKEKQTKQKFDYFQQSSQNKTIDSSQRYICSYRFKTP